ncbi:hypothetical protein QFZ79_002892 [Arthrobacter sp. V4I6]|uniref:minor capsid protein n=1 Tax=Arthrobacter sp. V4I6 TaxID=3042281 RepID=UPI002781420C|nr:minor capsid protein [Arthrobacter sp. V4I6]MDQ0854781.1 hypothetical protein [Arthrobacter sp. V4I6]
MAGFRLALLGAIGEYLQTQGVGKWSTPWAATDTAISLDALPASPDKAIAMTLYPVANPGGTDQIMGLQLRIRGKPNNRTEDKDILDKAEDALHGVRNTTWGGIPIVYVEHRSGTYLGTDTANRPEHTQNYYITLTREGLNRTD